MRESRNQFAGTLLLVLTALGLVGAVLSIWHLSHYVLHDDGVSWVDQKSSEGNRVVAAYLTSGGPGEIARIHLGDQLISIEYGQTFPIKTALDVPRALWQIPLYIAPVRYNLRRDGIVFQKDNIYISGTRRDNVLYYQYVVGFFYLGIGLFVYYRRTSAAKSRQFFLLCLTSFGACCFHYSGYLNTFDEFMYWGNVAMHLLAPAIFLHFCLTFQTKPRFLEKRGAAILLYIPSAALFLLFALSAGGLVNFATSLLEIRWLLDRVSLAFEMLLYFAGAAVLAFNYKQAEDPMVRRQFQYLRNGAILGLTPFTLCYVIPFIFGAVPTHFMSLSVLSLGLIPLTWAYAITRYRLMDVDIIFQQGYVYTLATFAVIGVFYGLIFLIAGKETISPTAFVVLIAFATFVFQPVRRWMQEQLDRWVFYRDRYDARLTITEFARELSSETDQNAMLAKVSERLLRTLSIQQVGFFLFDEAENQFRLHSSSQRQGRPAKSVPARLDLSFLAQSEGKQYLFFERPKHLRGPAEEWSASVRDTIAELDFTYYVACKSRGRTIAFFGVSRTTEGDFLSTDDTDLLITLSNYVAIAIENSSLYTSLQQKADEYERLKEFSENIVESINVGILAASLDGIVESWNSQIEKLTGVMRKDAVGRSLRELFPPELCQKFDEMQPGVGPQNVYRTVLRPHTESAPSFNGNGVANGNGRNGHHPEKPALARESIVNMAVAPLVSKDLKQIGRLIIFDDITDREELERRLVQADKLSSIGLLAAGVAHEVNTPLAVISTYAQMLAKQVSGDDQKAKLLDKIAKQTFRASEIVNSLLNFSRTSPTDFADLDLNRVIRETASLVEHQFQKAGITCDLSFAENLPTVRGNSGKLQQVFLNLFINARDAMAEGGLLTVRTRSEAGFAVIEVADTGQGIPPEYLARIYDPFFTTKGPKKGTGLGLSISYGIVHEHEGNIEVDSSVGNGTRFRLEFPGSALRRVRPVAPPAEALPA